MHYYWLALTASFVFASSALASPTPKTFIYCSEASPASFNPQLATDLATFNATAFTIYNRLVEFESGSTRVIPALADSWDASKDGKTFTFKLRKGVKFQTTAYFKPTRDFNADDVMFTFERMFKKDHPFHTVNGGTYEFFKSMGMGKLLKSIERVDDLTVRFTLEKPEAPFLANMAMAFASILSKEYADQLLAAKTPGKIDMEPIGTGPFAFKSYKKDNVIRFLAHPEFFRGRSPLDRVVFAITKDPNVRVQKLKRGECHFAADPPAADLKALRVRPNLRVVEREGLNVGYLAFNTLKPPLDKVDVRRAFNHAMNRASYMEAVYLGNAVPAKNPIPPSLWSYNETVKDYDYDPAKAKELLAKAGFPNGIDVTMWYLPVSRPYNPNGKKMGEMMQADLAKVGIRVTLESFDWGTYLAKARKGEHQIVQLGWTGDNGDPDNFLVMLLGCEAAKSGSNYARWCDPKFQKLMEAAKVTIDQKERTRLYEEGQEIFKTEAPWVTLAHAKVFRAMDARVEGFQMSPFGTDSFYGVDLKTETK